MAATKTVYREIKTAVRHNARPRVSVRSRGRSTRANSWTDMLGMLFGASASLHKARGSRRR